MAKPGRLVIRFDEVAVDGKFHPMRTSNHGTGNAVQWELLSPGSYRLETFEPYTLKFMDVTVMNGGEMEIAAPWLRRYINRDASRARFSCSDRDLCNIFEAARATFAQNAVDVFTDCPSRERAGWLCDSYFTARVAQLLCGDTRLEKQFLTNFLAEKRFAPLPEGVFPMCYPGDHPDGGFIVNWNLWLVLEMEEYLARSGDRELVDAFRPRFQKLFGYLRGFRNSDGLLENEPGWVFVEWSKANDFTKDVNYPSNMLYAEALDAFARMYNDTESAKEAAAVRVTVYRQSWNGMWFRDHAVRNTDGKLKVKDDISETCQYYAFFTHVADFATHSALWQRLIDEFGPSRDAKKIHPTIWPSNMFIGMYLRFELLSRAGLGEKILSDMSANLAKMAAMTGTLWEHNWPIFSLNHGFASHAAIFLSRDILGVTRIDVPNKILTWHETDVATKSVEMVIPVPGGEIVAVRRQTAAGRFAYDFTLPAGWRTVEQKGE